MKYFSGVLLLFILIIAAGCSGKADVPETDYPVINNPEWGSMQDYGTPPFRFELMDSILIETPNDEVLGSIWGIVTDKNGHIYFMDQRQSKLVSISADGQFRWMTGQEGKGPGDFENAYSMVTDGEHLLIGNISGSRLDRFDFNGNFLNSLNLDEKFSLSHFGAFTYDGLLAVTTPLWGAFGRNVYFLKLHKDSVEIVNHFTVDVTEDVEVPQGFSGGAGIHFYKDLVVSGSLMNYKIRFIHRDSTLQRVIKRDFDKNMSPGFYTSGSSRSMRMFGGVRAPVFLPNGVIIVEVDWPENVPDSDGYMKKSAAGNAPEVIYKNSLDFYSPEGELLYSMIGEGSTPEIGTIQHVDENGIIYTATAEPKPVIYRYKLLGPEQL